ncbi:uncharacterized protein LOC131890934 [Tigriopus californicus]|uniref:uncharacterized protein LOC131890934 n=1 Tax=Tigriopus californicus TaxID=6832 RepID=UPI0027DAA274|nr:uncharacterized protein LOC131890934 [Tigriopus californicus]
MHSVTLCGLIVLLCVGAEMVTDKVLLRVGESSLLKCGGNYTWEGCTWKFKNRTCSLTVENKSHSCNIINGSKIMIVKESDSECSLKIENVSSNHVGMWECSKIFQIRNAEPQVQCHTEVHVIQRAHLEVSVSPLGSSNPRVARCRVLTDTTQLDVKVTGYVGPSRNISSSDRELVQYPGCVKNDSVEVLFALPPSITYGSNVVDFKCRANQVFTNGTMVFSTEAFETFHNYLPPKLHDRKHVFSYQKGEDLNITFRFEASPPPKDDEVNWKCVKSDEHEENFIQTYGSDFVKESVRYAFPNGSASLIIKSVPPASCKLFHFIVKNSEGQLRHSFVILTKDTLSPSTATKDTERLLNSAHAWGLSWFILGLSFLCLKQF